MCVNVPAVGALRTIFVGTCSFGQVVCGALVRSYSLSVVENTNGRGLNRLTLGIGGSSLPTAISQGQRLINFLVSHQDAIINDRLHQIRYLVYQLQLQHPR